MTGRILSSWENYLPDRKQWVTPGSRVVMGVESTSIDQNLGCSDASRNMSAGHVHPDDVAILAKRKVTDEARRPSRR